MTRNERLGAARLWMHDRQCTGGAECVSREDHARRTQHEFARAAEAALPCDLATLIHDNACHAQLLSHDGCANRAEHTLTAERAAMSLYEAMGGSPAVPKARSGS